MFCEKCGAKNNKDAKFCGSCGHKINSNEDKEKRNTKKIPDPEKVVQETKEKIVTLSKKNKIIMGTVLIITVIAIIILSILLNNPVKKIEDGLESYYKNYQNNHNQELVEMGKVLKSNKENTKVLTKIKETTHKIMEKWVKNFNTEYQDKEELLESYNKVSGALKDIYNYYNGLEYMLDKELYNSYYEELKSLHSSKHSYLTAKEYENKNNEEYNIYYYYQKVIENDCYYKEAAKYVSEYVKDEIAKLKEKAEEFIKINDNSTNIEIYNCYIEELKYLEDNKTSNNIDLSSTEEYKKMYENVINKIVEYTKKIAEEYEKNNKLDDALKIIDDSLKLIKKYSNQSKELEELKKSYEDKKPVKLTSMHRVSKSSSVNTSLWKKEINNIEYEYYISFAFVGKIGDITYNLNKEYKRLKMNIIRDQDWKQELNGYFIITGDGKEIYKSEIITNTSEFNSEIDIDVNNINELKIEFITESKAEGWNNFYIYLVEPYLYK